MGHATTVGWASAVEEGFCTLEVAVYAHITGNFYPPLHPDMVPPALEAIKAVEAGDRNKVVFHGPRTGRPFSADVLVDELRLWPFVTTTDEEEC